MKVRIDLSEVSALYSPSNLLFIAQCRPIETFPGVGIAWTNSDSPQFQIPLRVTEDRYKVSEGYKIGLKADFGGFESPVLYQSDCESMIDSGSVELYRRIIEYNYLDMMIAELGAENLLFILDVRERHNLLFFSYTSESDPKRRFAARISSSPEEIERAHRIQLAPISENFALESFYYDDLSSLIQEGKIEAYTRLGLEDKAPLKTKQTA